VRVSHLVRTVVVAFALLALPPVSAPAAASDFWDEVRTPGLREWKRNVREARAAAAAGNWDAALAESEAAIARIEDRAEAHVLRGRALGELGRLDVAITAFSRALELDETTLDSAEDGVHAARIAASARAPELAVRILPRVLGNMRPSSERADLYALYGDVLSALGPEYLRRAIVAYREATRHGGRGGVQAALALALALRRAGEELEASDLARDVAARGRVDALVGGVAVPEPERAARRAVVLDAIGDRAGAREAWEEALASEVWRVHTLYFLGRGPEP